MPEPVLFDPEIEELLREVASDPRSSLLRVPRSIPAQAAFDPAWVARASSARIPAEEHLLRTYRSEVAYLLRRICVSRLWQNARPRRLAIRHVTVNRKLELYDEHSCRADAQQAVRLAHSESRRPADAIQFQEGTVPDENASIKQIALVSMRFEPTDQARIYVALDAIYHDDYRLALRLLEPITDGMHDPLNVGSAWINRGSAHSHLGDWRQARDAYRKASIIDPPSPLAPMDWFRAALILQERDDALEAARRIDGLLEPSHAACRDFIAAVKRRRSVTSIGGPTHPHGILASIEDVLGPTSLEVAHAVA